MERSGAQTTKVYQGHLNGELVAVKRVILEGGLHTLFKREARLLSNFDHPGIVNLLAPSHEHEVEGQKHGCLILPWSDSNLLDAILASAGKHHDEIIRQYVLPLARALDHIHGQNKVHRDLKPQNILLSSAGRPVIADFGIGKDNGSVTASTVGSWESSGYTPDRRGTGKQQDVYSFGVLFLELLVGRQVRGIHERFVELSNLTGISDKYVQMIRKCLADDPEKRFPDMSEVKDELESVRRSIWVNEANEFGLEAQLTQGARQGYLNLSNPLVRPETDIARLLDRAHLDLRPLGKDSPDTLILSADAFEFFIKVEKDSKVLRITSVRESSAYGKTKEGPGFSLWKFPIKWKVVNQPMGGDLHHRTFEEVFGKFDEWQSEGMPDESLSRLPPTSRNQFSQWQKFLEAKDVIYRGDGKPLRYDSVASADSPKEFRFSLQSEIESPLEGTFWVVKGTSNDIGEVVAQDGSNLQIHFRREISRPFPQAGQLIPSVDGGTRVALERQQTAIKMLATKKSVNPKLGGIFAAPTTQPPVVQIRPDTWFNPSLDDDKRDAVSTALGSSALTLVQGPPGTGKTTFISELVEQLLARDPLARILIVSQTHVAIDNVVERLAASELAITVTRLGHVDSPSISSSSIGFLMPNQIRQWSKNLKEKSERYILDLAMGAGLTAPQSAGLKNLIGMQRLLREKLKIEEDIGQSGTPSQFQTSTLKAIESKLVGAKNLIPDQLEGATAPQTLDDIREMIEVLVDAMADSNKFLETLALQDQWINRLETTNEVEPLFLKSRNVLAGTCLGFLAHPSVKDLEFDYCILDEASRATPTEALVPFSRARKCILVGDSEQLGPSNFEFEGQGELLKSLGIEQHATDESLFSYLEQTLPQDAIVRLTRQHRMVEPIGNLISECFYGGILKSEGRAQIPSLTDEIQGFYAPLMWVSTEQGQYKNDSRESRINQSFFNIAEALEICDRLRSLAKAAEVGYVKLPADFSCLIITPYAGQRRYIEEQAKFLNLDGITLEVLTVDAVQGREADLVFYSPVRSNGSNGSNVGFTNSAQRTNVALSRARQCLFIVGDREFWGLGSSPLSTVLNYLEQLGGSSVRFDPGDDHD